MDFTENDAVEAMKLLQKELEGKVEDADLTSEDKVVALVKEIRSGMDDESVK